MKKRNLLTVSIILTIMFIVFTLNVKAQNIGINSTGATPNSSAMLDIDVSALTEKKGLLIPRMTAAEKAALITLPEAAQGLVVYQVDGLQGFYYNTSTNTTPNWSYLFSSTSGGWSLNGNAGTTPGVVAGENFLGTTDPTDIIIATNSVERMRFTSAGRLGIGTNNPQELIHISNNSSGLTSVRFDNPNADGGSAIYFYEGGALKGHISFCNSNRGFCTAGANAFQMINNSGGNTYIASGGNAGSHLRLEGSGVSGFIKFNTGNTETMRLTATGSLGIGILVPLEKLHVVGNVRISLLSGTGNRMVQADANGTLIPMTSGTSSQVLLGTGVWGAVPGAGNDWSLTGNAGTTAGTNFIGTTDNIDVVIKRQSVEGFRITTGGAFWASGNTTTGVTPASGAGARMMWIPVKRAFRVGEVTGTTWDNANVGLNSFACGMNTIASAYLSIAMGYGTVASGEASTAIGYSTTASQTSSTAMGGYTIASGFFSTSMGHYTNASGNYSTAFGSSTTASGENSTSMGINSLAGGAMSTAIGNGTTASGVVSIATGYHSIASGDYSTAMGHNTTASGDFSTSMGYNTISSGDYSTAMGYNATASGIFSTALCASTASSVYSFSSGVNTISSGTASTAMGSSATASGDFSTAIGESTTASGLYSTAMGNYTSTSGLAGSFILGDNSTNAATASTAANQFMSRFNGGYVFYTDAALTLSKTIVFNNGKVGIGIATPSEKLTVTQTADAHKNVIYGYANQTSSITDYQTAGVTGFGQGDGIANSYGYGFGIKGIGSTNGWGAVGVYAALGTIIPNPILNNNFYAIYADAITTGANRYAGVFMNGNVGIGCANPVYKLHVIGDIASSTAVRAPAAFIVGAITACSDTRFKKDFTEIENPLQRLLKMHGFNYYWKKDEFPDRSFNNEKQIGFKAQEMQSLLPEIVVTDTDGYLSIDYSKLSPMIVEAIKEQQKQIEDLKAIVAEQQKQINQLLNH